MLTFPGLRQLLVSKAASKEERQPIMTPIEDPDSQSERGYGRARGNGVEMTPKSYDTVEAASPAVAVLRDPGGGFLGPAAEEDHHEGPHHHQDDPYNHHHHHNNHRPSTTHRSEPWLSGWCEGSSRSERRLVTVVVCQLVLLVVIMVVMILLMATKDVGQENICTSVECYKAVGEVLGWVEEGAAPCENFPRYACGGWQRRHPLPEATHRWSVFDAMNEETLLALTGLLEEAGLDEDPQAFRAVRTVYRACVNDTQWQEVGAAPLLALLQQEGGLPMLDPAWTPPPNFQPMLTMARLRRSLAGQFLVSLKVEPDSANTSHNVIYLSQGVLPVRRDRLLSPDSSHRASRVAYMRRTGEQLLTEAGTRENRTYLATLYKDINDLWQFYVKVAQITPEGSGDPRDQYNPMSVTELQNLTDPTYNSSQVGWEGYLGAVFQGTTTTTINGTQRVIVSSPAYFTSLLHLINTTQTRTIANYLLFPLVLDMGEETTTRLLPLNPLLRTLGRLSTRTWYDCAQKVKILLPFAVGGLYVSHHYRENVTSMAAEVVKDVTAAFRTTLIEASWMDAATLTEALKKLDHMRHLVAFPPMALNKTLMDLYHSDLPEVNETDHFGNMVALTAWHSRRSLLLLDNPLPPSSWPRGPLELNAFYSPLRNSIVLPIAVLQPPIFIPEPLTALNYGSLGAIIGHEVTHAFDNTGRLRDWTGSLKEWWSQATGHHYQERAQCFARQYSTYDASPLLPPHLRPGHKLTIDGERTEGENIADNGGLRAAWAAYRRRVEENEAAGRQPLRLPGLDHLTQDQLFFIGYGKVWCSQYTPYALRYVLRSDVHSPGPFRVLGTLQNSAAFASAFNCPINSSMNPIDKCILW